MVGAYDVVQMLLERGADPLITDSRGKLALQRAEYRGHTRIVELLRPLFSSPITFTSYSNWWASNRRGLNTLAANGSGTVLGERREASCRSRMKFWVIDVVVSCNCKIDLRLDDQIIAIGFSLNQVAPEYRKHQR
jgi:Ankyrin repeats (many copies)